MTSSDPTPSRLGMPNHYMTLDLLPGASQNEIHHAYKRAKMTYSSGSLAAYSILEDDNNEDIVREIEQAYEVLSNPSHRREYDLKMGFNTWTEEQNAKEEARSYSRPSVSTFDDETNAPSEPSYDEIAKAQLMAATAKTEETRRSLVRVVKSSDDGDFQFVANPEFESKIQNCSELSGAFLRAVRIYKQLTLEQLAARSKISPGKLTAIEEETLEDVYSQAVYLRGHVSIMCRVLSIPNAEDLSRKFTDRMGSEGKIPRQTL